MADIQLKFQLMKRETNVSNHVRWMEYIAGPEFITELKKGMERKSNLARLVKEGRQIVEEDIYSKNTTAGSGRIKDSISAGTVDSEVATLVLASDPAVAPSKGPFSSGDPGSFSYAAFFEDPKFNTFLPPKDDPLDPRRYRPFFEHMTSNTHRLVREMAMESMIRAIRKRMPRQA